jgi:hypothetical protein
MKIYICELLEVIEDSLSHFQLLMIAHLFLVGSKEVIRKIFLLTQNNVRFLMKIYICELLEVIEDSLSHFQ